MKKVIITLAIAAFCLSSCCCNNSNNKKCSECETEATECCDSTKCCGKCAEGEGHEGCCKQEGEKHECCGNHEGEKCEGNCEHCEKAE